MIHLKNVRGEKKFFEAIDRLIDVVGDQRERGWQENVDVRLDHQRRHLDTEAGGGWTPLDDEYRLKKVEDVGTVPILQYRGRMYRSLTQEGAPNFVRDEEASSLKVGSSDPKARWHHRGAGKLPAREVMRATDEEAQDHLQVFHDSYEATARADGWKVI